MNRISGALAVAIGVLTAIIPTFLLFQAVTCLFVIPLVLGVLCISLGIHARRTQGRFGQHVVWIAVVIMIVAVVLPFGMIAYYNRSGYPIVVIVPEGYRGPIKLITDRQRGIDVPLKEGKYTYQIPQSGTLLIKDDSPFGQWHSFTAFYASGNPIPTDHEGTFPPDAVSYHGLGSGVTTDSEGKREEYIEDFVGTKAELRTYVDRR